MHFDYFGMSKQSIGIATMVDLVFKFLSDVQEPLFVKILLPQYQCDPETPVEKINVNLPVVNVAADAVYRVQAPTPFFSKCGI